MQKNKQLLIWDSESLPTDSNDYVILWQSYTILDLNKEISIPQLVENNADDLRSRYLAFIYDLGELRVGKKRIIDYLEIRPNFSYWWMTLLVEKCNYSKSPQIDNIIKLMVFDDYLDQKHFTAIKIVTANKQLAEAIQILTDSYGVPFEWVKLSRQKPIKNIDDIRFCTMVDKEKAAGKRFILESFALLENERLLKEFKKEESNTAGSQVFVL